MCIVTGMSGSSFTDDAATTHDFVEDLILELLFLDVLFGVEQ